MKRVGFLLKVKEPMIDAYKRHHRAVWPDMLDALARNGWHNFSLYMRDDGLMFGYFEAEESFQASLDGMSKEKVNRLWQDLMAPHFEIPEGALADQSMLELEEVFHMD
jgi:L-rhamnose mutarotase